ncbi:hemolysin family protein [Paenibacillus hunanensis]|uniref:hemolysin family protein n=1 Tax=Paenibacillus hunanensis TaxID=539262 RepID=UPI002A6B0DA3|nr:hemolysin family protein [Paenibacillus hunanensis]WPP40821.1 hemolysin family protein [Paenibacillus hunanensis]
METINVILVILLILLTAFFVASEYSIIRVRVSRINQLAEEGNKNARAVQSIISKLDEFLSACQLGTTLTSLALGWLGESTIEELLHPLFVLLHIPEAITSILSFILAFLLLTYFEVVIGELVPKSFAIQVAEPMALFFARPMIVFYRITYPFNWVLSRSSRLITGLFGVKPISEHEAAQSEAELRFALSEGYKSGSITPTEYRYLNNVFDFDELVGSEIMVPRTEMIYIAQDATLARFYEIVKEEPFSLLPVALEGDKDKIIGLLNVKEVLRDVVQAQHSPEEPIVPFIRPVLQLIETVPARELLGRMQKDNIHMAVLLDEYGGTAGIVTLEDVLEEIVGDIPSKSDSEPPPTPAITKLGEKHYQLQPQALIHEVNRRLGTDIEAGEAYTIGGWIWSRKFNVREGDSVVEDGFAFTVTRMEQQHIRAIEVQPYIEDDTIDMDERK